MSLIDYQLITQVPVCQSTVGRVQLSLLQICFDTTERGIFIPLSQLYDVSRLTEIRREEQITMSLSVTKSLRPNVFPILGPIDRPGV